MPGNLDGITLGLNVGTELGSLDGFFDGSNDFKHDKIVVEDSPGYTDGKVF